MNAERIQSQLIKAPGWKTRSKKSAIARTYTFPSFRSALAFVQFVGDLAEAMGHHPAIDIRYDKVTLELTTHEEDGLTSKDFELARAIDSR